MDHCKCRLSGDMTGPEWAFRSVTRAHHIAHAAVFEKLGLREVGQPVLLFVLDDMRLENRSCSQTELCELLRLSPPTVTISLQSLEKRGYVQRMPDEHDRRRNCITLTELGIETAEKCRQAFLDIDEVMYAGFSEEERRTLTAMFNRIATNLSSFTQTPESEVTDRC